MKNRSLKLRREYLSSNGFSKMKKFSLAEAIELLQSLPKVNFIEGLEFAIQLGIDPKRSDQIVRGSVNLPHGTGRKIKVAVFASGHLADLAIKAGADIVGIDEITEMVKTGKIEFDVLISHPDQMIEVSKLGHILGPKGLMPNPKLGTVTQSIPEAVKLAKLGQVYYRNDKAGIVHGLFGLINFNKQNLIENFESVINAIKRNKPVASKGNYLKQLVISSTMGPGVRINLNQ